MDTTEQEDRGMEFMETSEYTLIEEEEICATAEHRVSGERNSSRILLNPSGSSKRRTPDTRVEEVGGRLHSRDTGSVPECISTSTDVN